MRRLTGDGWFIFVLAASLVGVTGWLIWAEVAARVECHAAGGRTVSTNGRWLPMLVYDAALKQSVMRPVYVTDDICVAGPWPFREVRR